MIAALVALMVSQSTPTISPAAIVPTARAEVEVAPCSPIRPGRPRVGCIVLGRLELGPLSRSPLYWYIDTFRTVAEASRAQVPRSMTFESHGEVWLFTIAGEELAAAREAHLVARIGPLPLVAANKFAVEYVEGDFKPDMVTRVHRHPGVEAFYTVAGETCLETPKGTLLQLAGGAGIMVPGGTPMKLTAIGPRDRFGFGAVLQDASKPFSTRANDWKPRGLCNRAS